LLIMKTFLTLSLLTIVHWQICHAQFTDNFSDNDFNANPSWIGTESKFVAIANELKLQAPATASTAYLSTVSSAINDAVWEFYVQLDFNPSSTNLSNIYLVSDEADLSKPLHGYFVKVGNTADEVSLYRQDGTTETRIIDGSDGRINLAIVKIKIKITRDTDGNWQLFSDVGKTGVYASEGVVIDNTYSSSAFFGVHCKYTDTRADKFHFDDFSVTGNPFVDIDPPILQQINIPSASELDLIFSESLNKDVAENTNNYSVDHDLSHPSSALLQADLKTVRLSFTKNFPNGILSNLSVSGIQDGFANELSPVNKSFLFFQPTPVRRKDIIITEIMADPTPSIGLPNAEFIELMNKSIAPIDLGNWRFAEGNSPEKFPSVILLPNEYLILTSASNTSLFSSFGKVIALTSFPTQTNGGDVIVLEDAEGNTIDSVHYTDAQYNDDDKKQGGWTLEIIDPMNTCAEANNWTASEDVRGGTPGKQNSVYANKPDLTGPKLISAMPRSPENMLLTFSEKLNHVLPSLTSFNLDPTLTVKSHSFLDASLTTISVNVQSAFQAGKTYTVSVSNIYDCAGNAIQEAFNKLEFGLPERADSVDIIVNEVLFNPRPTGVDFVEIYNRSAKYINLKNWSIAVIENSAVINSKTITTTDFLIKPSTYAILTPDVNILVGEYPGSDVECIFEITVPSLRDDQGSIVLLDENKKTIDAFSYTDDMHSVFIKDPEGFSLERIQFDHATNEPNNWRSASSSLRATPGYINSNATSEVVRGIAPETIRVEPEIFIPVTGTPEFVEIKYNFSQGGTLANVKIYDIEGREVKQIANNEVLGTEGFFRWDGDNNNGGKARVGYYVVNFEVVNVSGAVQTFRKRVVVATRF
jgi:hypothetical protein